MPNLTRRNLLSAILAAPLAMLGWRKQEAESKPTGYIATPKNTPPSLVLDRFGKQWECVLWVNVITGEAEVAVLNGNGERRLTADMRRMLTKRVVIPGPITLIPCEIGKPHPMADQGDWLRQPDGSLVMLRAPGERKANA